LRSIQPPGHRDRRERISNGRASLPVYHFRVPTHTLPVE
jgi:hypothetical protein